MSVAVGVDVGVERAPGSACACSTFLDMMKQPQTHGRKPSLQVFNRLLKLTVSKLTCEPLLAGQGASLCVRTQSCSSNCTWLT